MGLLKRHLSQMNTAITAFPSVFKNLGILHHPIAFGQVFCCGQNLQVPRRMKTRNKIPPQWDDVVDVIVKPNATQCSAVFVNALYLKMMSSIQPRRGTAGFCCATPNNPFSFLAGIGVSPFFGSCVEFFQVLHLVFFVLDGFFFWVFLGPEFLLLSITGAARPIRF